ncbi:hypothetical protein Sste5346_000233 [Sporothrix stenoceras]|uniref:RING-type domain-containing protein n=1 Tax=Sporothrix stenoceras TaxID=5173 RepID=A0ABR3ZYM9_9PEZI
MPIINQVLEGAALIARQATSTAATAITSAATGTTGTIASAPTTSSSSVTGASGAATTTTNPPPSGTGIPPSATTTTGGGGGGGGGSSPLLFFVALGFGVVFTNLWIIVGVKYCFRYNARARQLRLAAEEGGDQINLDHMPHPRRRRREKKLMTIDEVNEKFPMMKYKTWVATRAEEGLPTTGGINAPSRSGSVRSAAGAIEPLDETERQQRRASTEEPEDSKDKERPTTSIAEAGTSVHDTTTADASDNAAAAAAASGPATTSSAAQDVITTDATRASLASADGDAGLGVYHKDPNSDEHYNHSDDDDDEHIDSALPPECVGTSGDTCAICIDTLEDDDDVRGLTCGHAFHAVCLDPWLTSRRACCPLCKADYYTPKPRPPPAEGVDGAQGGPVIVGPSDRNRANAQGRSNTSWRSAMLPSRFMLGPRNGNAQDPERVFPQVEANEANANAAPAAGAPEVQMPEQPAATHGGGWLRSFRRRNGEPSQETSAAAGNAAAPAAPTAEVTPSQLEAGVRSQ